jgi:hypothetical protein
VRKYNNKRPLLRLVVDVQIALNAEAERVLE